MTFRYNYTYCIFAQKNVYKQKPKKN